MLGNGVEGGGDIITPWVTSIIAVVSGHCTVVAYADYVPQTLSQSTDSSSAVSSFSVHHLTSSADNYSMWTAIVLPPCSMTLSVLTVPH